MEIIESGDACAVCNIEYGFSPTPCGEMVAAFDACGLCFAGFVAECGREAVLNDLSRRFPCAHLVCNDSLRCDIFAYDGPLHLVGTPFRHRVWRALMKIGAGETVSYSQLARMAGMPRAVRAVASAVGANPVSVIIPCHRVVRSDGSVGEYHWGVSAKRQLLEYEGALRRRLRR